MAFCKVFDMFGLLILGSIIGNVVVVMGGSKCDFPAIYNFGDSNSDTGGRSAAIFQVPPPYGQTFFKKPSGRLSDGRLILDFIAQTLDLDYLSAYLDSIAPKFSDGANFATGGSSILPGNFSPFDLGIQVNQFTQFKSRTRAFDHDNLNDCYDLPDQKDFSKALYTFDIGQNDLAIGFRSMTPEQIKAAIPNILNQFELNIKRVYHEGARAFWIHNTGPIGCLPLSAITFKARNGTLDQYGCVSFQNELAQDFNLQLKNVVSNLRTQFPSAFFTYVDVYSVKLSLIVNAKKEGFVEPLKFCCGSLDPPLLCGTSAEVNGTTIKASLCADPGRHISWDGLHYTEAANKWIASRILDGSVSDPPVSILAACP
ncbi:hypothetical protein UlMin_015010 [Ulmus minor]